MLIVLYQESLFCFLQKKVCIVMYLSSLFFIPIFSLVCKCHETCLNFLRCNMFKNDLPWDPECDVHAGHPGEVERLQGNLGPGLA